MVRAMNGATMDQTQALQNLLNGTASEEEINLLKGGLASGKISIGWIVNQSVNDEVTEIEFSQETFVRHWEHRFPCDETSFHGAANGNNVIKGD
jgi:hypothetical protein